MKLKTKDYGKGPYRTDTVKIRSKKVLIPKKIPNTQKFWVFGVGRVLGSHIHYCTQTQKFLGTIVCYEYII
jgi:hypothetical protein